MLHEFHKITCRIFNSWPKMMWSDHVWKLPHNYPRCDVFKYISVVVVRQTVLLCLMHDQHLYLKRYYLDWKCGRAISLSTKATLLVGPPHILIWRIEIFARAVAVNERLNKLIIIEPINREIILSITENRISDCP